MNHFFKYGHKFHYITAVVIFYTALLILDMSYQLYYHGRLKFGGMHVALLLLVLAYTYFFKRIKNIGFEIGPQGLRFDSLFRTKSLAWSDISEIIKIQESRTLLAQGRKHPLTLKIVLKNGTDNIEIDFNELRYHQTFLIKIKEYYKREFIERE
jgi:hypothetical protein